MVLIVVPGMLIGLAFALWVLFRRGWPIWIRIPGCFVAYVVAMLLGTFVLICVIVGLASLPVWLDWLRLHVP